MKSKKASRSAKSPLCRPHETRLARIQQSLRMHIARTSKTRPHPVFPRRFVMPALAAGSVNAYDAFHPRRLRSLCLFLSSSPSRLPGFARNATSDYDVPLVSPPGGCGGGDAMKFWLRSQILLCVVAFLALGSIFAGCGGGGNSGGGGGGGVQIPATPTGVSATPGNAQVVVAWSAVTSGMNAATSFHVKRSTTSGGPYTTIASPATTSYTDTSVANGTPYYYVVSAVNSAGESANSSEVTATPVAPPAAPTGLQAVAGNAQVVLSWTGSAGATGYHVKRGTASGGPYTQVGTPVASPYTDSGLTNGTPYYYVVTAVNAGGESLNSTEATATPLGTTSVTVNIDTLSNRHPMSPLVYGGAYPKDAPTITDSGMTVVRWGGDATSRYNWKTYTYNAGNDWYFEDFNANGFGDGSDADSVQFINDVKTAGGNPLMTMVMLPWVAKSAEIASPPNYHWSFSVAKYGAQCATDPYNSDAGNGIVPGTCNSNPPTYLTADPNDANVALIDESTSPCPATSPCTLFRSEWAAALATAFGSAPHFYNMDNEPEIWGSTHRDVHPNPSGYEELRDTYLRIAPKLKTWDPDAIRLGPITCCWWFYWNGANSNDRPAHASQDFFPWWLNEVYWRDQISGTPSVEVVDVHAYPESPDTSAYTQQEKQALTARIYREYWDPTYTSESGDINQVYTTYIQPNHAIAFRVPRLRALINTNYPGLPLSITEWSAAFAGEADYSTAIGDADAYGILGRERVYLASRWGAPDPANPNYQALKLYANYDGAHHTFGTTSVSATHNSDPNLFSVYAALGPAGTPLTIMVLNKDPGDAVNVTFNLNNFTAGSYTAYTLSPSSPNTIVKSNGAGIGSMTFAPYTVTLLVVTGAEASVPAAEWDLNPDVIMVPAGGTVTLNPYITSAKSGSATVTLSAPTIDSGGGTITIPTSLVTQTPLTGHGVINVAAGTTPGFYHFTVTGTDSTNNVAQKQGGWILVGNPPATLATTTDPKTGAINTPVTLAVTFNPGASQGAAPGAPTAAGATIRFTTDAGTLSGGTTGSTTSQLVTTNASGVASITLTLPSTSGQKVHVTAEGPYQLGHPVAKFTETAQ